MKKFLLLLCLAMAGTFVSALSHAQATASEEVIYCRGFIVGGLASSQVSGASRVDLWLAYNYLVQIAALEKGYSQPKFQEGRMRFTEAMSAGDVQSLLDKTADDCGRGRSSHQITGW